MKINFIKRIAAFTAASALAFTASVTSLTAFASDGEEAPAYAITIKGAAKIGADGAGNKYTAYQLFKGNVSVNDDTRYEMTIDGWGSGFSSENGLTPEYLIENLKEEDIFKNDDGVSVFAGANDAKSLADILENENDDSALMKQFAQYVSPYMTENGVTGEFSEDGDYEISGLSGGYYLVKDESSDNDGSLYSYSLPIIQVAGNVMMKIKSDVPALTKSIISVTGDGDIEENGAAAAAGVGSKVEFELTGTLPFNYADYDKYTYKFTDTLDKGFTLDEGSLKVSYDVMGSEELPVILYHDKTAQDIAVGQLSVTGKANEVGGTDITVSFANMKEIIGNDADYSAVRVVVTYRAVVNKYAEVGPAGNKNLAQLEFSNNPNRDGSGTTSVSTDKTPEELVNVYIFGIDMDKNDGAETPKPIEGAVFNITRDGDLAVFAEMDKGYIFAAWYSDSAPFDAESWAKENSGYLTAVFGAEASEIAASLVTEVVTNADGDLDITGLAPGKYLFTETKAPSNKKKAAPFTVTLAAAGTAGLGYNGQLDDEATVLDSSDGYSAMSEKNTLDKGIATINVIDPPIVGVPGTGGLGAYVYYIIGGMLVILAIIILVVLGNKKKKNT